MRERVRGESGRGRGGSRRSEYDGDEFVEDDDDRSYGSRPRHDDSLSDESLDEEAPVRRRRPAVEEAPARPGRRRIEFQDDEDTGPRRAPARRRYADEDEEDERPLRRRRQRPSERLTLMNLCTPVFAYAAMLPREGGSQVQPPYQQFRHQVMAALQRIEAVAPDHRIDPDDAAEAVYALSMFLDEQVANSDWVSAQQWMLEPLWKTLHNDAEGGVNFFRRLDDLADRQRDVKAVYLACLSLGFTGRYGDIADASQRAAQLNEIRQRLIREIHPKPMEKLDRYFPEGYVQAQAIEATVPPPPRWWLIASGAVVLVSLLIYLFLLWYAGRISQPHVRQIERASAAVGMVAVDDAPWGGEAGRC